MYKKSDGKIGFSFGRLITNAVPNFAFNNAENDAVLGLQQQDSLFAHQIRLSNPRMFDELSIFACGVVEAKSQSRTVLGSLQKHGIINKTDGSLHTELISKKFPNQVPQISIHRQRQLVCMLFFWEEELTRWRLLDEEEAEIRNAIEKHRELDGENAENEALKVALGVVSVKRSAPPSSRGAEGNLNFTDQTGEASGLHEPAQSSPPPPEYHETQRTVSVSGGRDHINEEGYGSRQESHH